MGIKKLPNSFGAKEETKPEITEYLEENNDKNSTY